MICIYLVLIPTFFQVILMTEENQFDHTLMRNIISNLLPQNDCIYVLIENDTNLHSQVDYLLNKLEIPVFVVTFQEYSTKANLSQIYRCLEAGYIIAAAELDQHPKWRMFRPHNNLIAIYENCAHECLNQLREAIYQDISIFLVNCTRSPSNEKFQHFQSTTIQLFFQLYITVTSLSENKIMDLAWLSQPGNAYLMQPKSLIFNKPVKIITAEYWVPYPKSIDTDNLPGFEVDIFKLVVPNWPLSFSIRPAFSWTPMVNEVVAREAEFSLNGHWEFRLLEEDVDFISYMLVETTFLVPRPTRLPLETFMFQSLNELVWLGIIVALTLASIVINSIYKLNEPVYYNNSGMITVAFFSANSTSAPAESILLRGAFFFMAFNCLLISTSYSAGFSAIKNVPPTRRPIRTYQHAVEDRISCHIISDYLQGLLNSSGDEYKIKFAERIIVHDDAIPLIGACVAMDLMPDHYFQNFENDFSKIGNLMELKEVAQSTKYSIVVSKKSPYFRDVQIGVSRLLEHGHILHLLKYVKYDFIHSLDDLNRFVESAGSFVPGYMKEMQGVFCLLLVGHALGAICFCIERIHLSGTRRMRLRGRRFMNKPVAAPNKILTIRY